MERCSQISGEVLAHWNRLPLTGIAFDNLDHHYYVYFDCLAQPNYR